MTNSSIGVAFEHRAREVLETGVFEYAIGAAGDTYEENCTAWANIRLVPRVLRDVTTISLATTVLGSDVDTPLIVAPTAMHRLFDKDGELSTAIGAEAAGAIYVVSTAANTSIEDIAAAAPAGQRWLQLYVNADRSITRELCLRASAAGCRALVVTVDAAVQRAHIGPMLSRSLPLPNMAPQSDQADIYVAAAKLASDLTTADISEITSWTDLPIIVKGVLRADDAIACVKAGAAGIAVSNHGGRQLNGCVSTASALPAIVDAVGDTVDVYVDGGLQSGTDVVKAMAIGARAVMIGRPILWGLAVGGAAGVHDILSLLQDDVRRTMGLCGITSPKDATADLVANRPRH